MTFLLLQNDYFSQFNMQLWYDDRPLFPCQICFIQMRFEGEMGGNTQAKIDGGRSHIVYIGHNLHAQWTWGIDKEVDTLHAGCVFVSNCNILYMN